MQMPQVPPVLPQARLEVPDKQMVVGTPNTVPLWQHPSQFDAEQAVPASNATQPPSKQVNPLPHAMHLLPPKPQWPVSLPAKHSEVLLSMQPLQAPHA
jgi:hypothetical protein